MGYLATGPYGTEILLWLIVLLFAFSFIGKIRDQRLKIKFAFTKDRLFASSVLLFIVYCLLSSFWALDSELAWQHGLRIMEMFLLFFVLYLGPLDFKTMTKWFLLGSILPVFLGIYQFIWQSAPAWKWLGLAGHAGWEGGSSIISGETLGRVLRAYGSFNHPNVFGGYLTVALLMLLLSRKSKVESRKFVILFFVIYCLLLVALFFTFSRSAMLALGIVLLVYFFAEKIALKDYIKKIISTLLPILILIIILIPVLAVRVRGDSAYETRSIDERLTGVSESFQIIKNNLWFGVGAGNYTLAVYNLNSNLEGWKYQPVHNVGLLLLAELGVVGVIFLIFIFVSFFRYQITDIKNLSINKSCLVIFFMLSAICYLVLCFFDHYLYSSYAGLMISGVYWALVSKFHTQ